jgi:hypothetical protein
LWWRRRSYIPLLYHATIINVIKARPSEQRPTTSAQQQQQCYEDDLVPSRSAHGLGHLIRACALAFH